MDYEANEFKVTFSHAVESDVTDMVTYSADNDSTATVTPSDPNKMLQDILQTYKALDEAVTEMKTDNFDGLRSLLSGYRDRDSAEAFCETNEIAWIEGNFPADKIVRFKNGKVKVGKHLPAPYASAKSVLLSAIENGIPFYDADGNPVGKTAMQNKNKDASKTPEEKVTAMLDSICKLLPQCSDTSVTADAAIQRLRAFL